MRSIAERLLLREATTTEFRVLNGAGHIAIGVDELNCSRDANRSALGINESLHLINV